jgi:porin
MLKPIALSICATLLLGENCQATGSLNAAASAAATSASPPPDLDSLRIKGLNLPLPGPQDTIDPDFAGIRSSLASLGIGYIGYTNNSFFDNTLPAERATFGQQPITGRSRPSCPTT